MAADVDKRIPEDKKACLGEDERLDKSQGGERPSPGRSKRSWIIGAMSTLLMFIIVPLLAFGYTYYQDSQLLKRHVSSTSVSMFYASCSADVFSSASELTVVV